MTGVVMGFFSVRPFLLVAGLFLSQIQILSAADLPALKTLFAETFWNTQIYQEGRCGDNIKRFWKLATERGIDLEGAEVLVVFDKGPSSLEGAHPYFARENGSMMEPKPEKPPYRHTGEAEWSHHVVLKAEGHIIDFDFMNGPTVIPEKNYFFQMFLNPNYRSDLQKIQSYLGTYAMEIWNDDGKMIREAKLIELYPNWFKSLPDCSDYLKKT
jgi:hypothetical protein